MDSVDEIESLGVAPDGSPVLLYLALPGHAVAATIHAAVPAAAAVLELGCGVGRVTRPLADLGHPVTAVDYSPEMLRHVVATERIERVCAELFTLDLSPRRWSVVVLASHFINDDQGASFLATAARHLAPGGCVLVERYRPGWVDTVEPGAVEVHGVGVGIRDIHRPGIGALRATMVYEVRGQRFEQPFSAQEVDDQRLAAMAATVGLGLDAVLDDDATWVRLGRR
jgi:SAM-dependent methyltransferase